jgi:ribosomal protein S1
VLVLQKKQKKITVSAKSSLIVWAAHHDHLPKITDLSVGQLLPGYVKDFQEYGCFVEVPSGLVGLCPKACLADEFVTSPRDVYSLNQVSRQ